ncbi:MAG: ROK family protein, partial [Ktedonobacteraceae bacterium]|nr:ROK family protein [Ktedonobacteraceae bacterium]
MNTDQPDTSPAILAFDLGGTRIKAGLVQGATVSALRVLPVDESEGAGGVVAQLITLGRHYLASHAISTIGISVRGIVDPQAGVIVDLNAPLSCLVGYPLMQAVSNALGVATIIENDARMYTLGELTHGSGRGYANLVCLTLGTGTGSGVVMGGRVLRGPRNVAGILGGHLTVQAD